MPSQLPQFDRPPLDEVAISVQFEPLQKLHVAHLGAYWSRIRAKYPHTEDQPPVAHQIEEALKPPSPPQVGIVNLPGMPLMARSWFLDQTRNQLIQVQNDRFIRNWRQLDGTERYPRFPPLLEKFKDEWDSFRTFVVEEDIGPININQCELTYVNHIERGMGWQEFSELDKVFSFFRPAKPSAFLPAPEVANWGARYNLPQGRGRLHAQLNTVFRSRDLKLVLAFTLIARGAPADNTTEQVLAWFNMGHEWIVRAFDELTEPRMHEVWKKKT